MKTFSVFALALMTSAASYASLYPDTSCEKNAALRAAAGNALKHVTSQQNFTRTAVEGLVSAQVGNVGDTKGSVCSAQWQSYALGLEIKGIAMLPKCGVVLSFDSSKALGQFARTSMMLGSNITTHVMSTNMAHSTTHVVPVCAKLK